MTSLNNRKDTYESPRAMPLISYPLDPENDTMPADVQHVRGRHMPWCGLAQAGNEVHDHGPMCEGDMKQSNAHLPNGDAVGIITALARPYFHGDYPATARTTAADNYVLLYLSHGSKDLAEVLLPIGEARRIAAQLQWMANQADGIDTSNGPSNGVGK